MIAGGNWAAGPTVRVQEPANMPFPDRCMDALRPGEPCGLDVRLDAASTLRWRRQGRPEYPPAPGDRTHGGFVPRSNPALEAPRQIRRRSGGPLITGLP